MTVLYGIYTELRAKRCREMRIDRLLVSYRKALAKVTAPAIPALHNLKKGRALNVCENYNPSMQSPAITASKSASLIASKQAPNTGHGYGLINDIKAYQLVSTVREDGYYTSETEQQRTVI